MEEQEEDLLRQVELDDPEQAENMLDDDDDEDAVVH